MRAVRRSNGQQGSTLVELVLSLLLLSLAAGLFVGAFQEGNAMYDAVEARKEMLQEGRMALLRAVREIRQVRSPADVVSAQATAMTFYGVSDSLVGVDFDPATGWLSLRRGSNTWLAAADVDSFALSYYCEDGTPAVPLVSPQETDIFRVGLFLRMRRGVVVVALETATYLRNM